MARRFTRRQHNALYLESGGCCALCGQLLEPGWHADHIAPYSKGGETVIENAQALCPTCNLKKGATTSMGSIELREFQKRFIDTALQIAKSGTKNTLVADVHAGSGKTLAACAAADKLMSAGFIDQVVVLVPRLNLAAQFELDWEFVRTRLPWQTTMRSINHMPNEPPLLLNGADGYITTYSSLISNPSIHIKQIAAYRTLIIFDEADRLGMDDIHDDGTKAAYWAKEISKRACMMFVMSGTPVRADGKPLLFAEYTEPDLTGYRKLIPDESSSYRDGVRDGYLRRFDFRLVDGGYTIVKLNERTDMTIQETETAIGPVLEMPDVYEPLVDTFIDRLNQQKRQIDSRLCGLIAANRQAHAKKIQAYIAKKYPAIKTLIAVSDDGVQAQTNLRRFKDGKHDVLITVSMAYIGYDYKPISVLLLLTSYRSEGYLRQLVARGLRVSPEIPADRQYCLAIAPDDKRMAEFVKALREESEWGYQQRLKKRETGNGGNAPGDYQQELSFVTDAFISDMRAMGFDPTGDLTPEKLDFIQSTLDRLGLPYAAPDAWALFQAMTKGQPDASGEPPPRPRKTKNERLKDAKSQLRKICGQCDYQLSTGHDTAETYKRLIGVYGEGTGKIRSIEEIEARILTVRRWMEQGRYDNGR